MKIALCLIVKGSNDEAKLLRRCLSNLAPYIDGIFITRTQRPGEPQNKAVAAAAKAFNARLSDFEWIDDFAAARNFNFAQVPADYDYILWCDADDMWRGLDKLRSTIEAHPQTDAFGFWYLYDWDASKKPIVVHRKTMLIKNDGCARWSGALHEDLEPTRQLDVQLIDGIERLHLSTPERAVDAATRNVEIAAKQFSAEPDDPRSYWNLANSQIGVAAWDDARHTFEQFLERSQSDEEKYLAHERLADICKSLGDHDEAVRELQIAIGIFPSLPDAYFQLAHLYYTSGNFDKAEEYCLQGLLRKPVIHKLIVFNPRDYDYNPMMLLAKVYYEKNRPDLMLPLLEGCLKIYPDDEHLQTLVEEGRAAKAELAAALEKAQELAAMKDKSKLRKALDRLPDDLKSHPAICRLRNQHFVKKTATGRDLVIYCGNTTHAWHPGSKGFIGGSEEAVINLSRALAEMGWNVTIYNNCGHKPVNTDGVTYLPFWEFNYRDKQDVVILWRWCKPLDAPINASKIFVDLHDVIPAGEFTEKRLQKITKIFVKSRFHRSLFPNVPDHKFAFVPNGIDLSLLQGETTKEPYLMINTSSPDRSLDVLPKLFKEVKKRVPRARLQWCYGWELFKNAHANDPKKLQWMNDTKRAMAQAGVEDLGRLSQEEVGKLYQKATVLAYPTEFAEIDCISVRKAQIARCLPVATDFGALRESAPYGYLVESTKTKDTWNRPYQFHFGLEDEAAQAKWVEGAVIALTKASPEWIGLDEWSANFAWSAIARRWHDILCA